MRWSVALPLFTALAVGAVGCRSNCARVESELRAREDDRLLLACGRVACRRGRQGEEQRDEGDDGGREQVHAGSNARERPDLRLLDLPFT